ncbi:MAG: sugar-binding domain-containing protein [Coraliomargaritaceae bacterium]
MVTLTSGRIEKKLESAWRFHLGDLDGAWCTDFDDRDWDVVAVPHDWSVEGSFSEDLEGATGYLPGGIGWYRYRFDSLDRETTYLLFDGVYNHSTVYLNGEKLGDHPYGYSPFYFDLSKHLLPTGNLLAVRVDHSRYCDSRWYTGSGIYRSVSLIGTAHTHIPVWGSFITTPEVNEALAVVELETKIANVQTDMELQTTLYDASGSIVAEGRSSAVERTTQRLEVHQPMLWDVDSPTLYRAECAVLQNGAILDSNEILFGIRSIRFDANEGFFLNGRSTAIQGVCLHHDGGCVGAAVPDDVWRRRLEKLKAAGVNAIRIAHNPASEAFLQLCDRMGFLVQDEFFDEWDNPKDKRKNMNEQHSDYISRGYAEHFQERAESDLKNVMLAHRNHPCIFQWSIGNEIEWTYPRNAEATGFFNADWTGNYFWEQPPHSIEEIQRLLKELPKGDYDIGETAQKLARWTRELDTSRPVVANCILPSSSYLSGYADALDVIGYSYRRVIYDYGHEHYPNLPIMGTENLAQWHEWKAIQERDFISGTFLWTGIDYLGEVDGQWPKRALHCGLLDTAGFENGSYHMMKTLWSEEPYIHLTSQTIEKSPYTYDSETGFIGEEDATAWERKTWIWHDVNTHWNYSQDEIVAVEVYSNCPEVELFLNGISLGKKSLADFPDRIYKWAVPYVAGKLEARSATASDALETAGAIAGIRLDVDGCHVVAQLVDASDVPVKTEEREIVFTARGDTQILGLDNGSPENVQDFQSDRIVTSEGRCLLVVSTNEGLSVEASVEGFDAVAIESEVGGC